ncbi:MAG TPA: hypothetical protein VIH61_03690 [Waddliaceae bacterium]
MKNKTIPISSPCCRESLTHEWQTTLEFTSMLTNELPENTMRIDISMDGKPFLIVPQKSFNVKECSKTFQKIFNNINDDIAYERVEGERCSIIQRGFSINPFVGLVWAIKKKHPWPIELQKTFSLRFKRQRQINPWLDKINIMVIKQYCTLMRNKTIPIKIIKDSMMRTYIHRAKNEGSHRQIKKDIAKVSRKKAPGWQKGNTNVNDSCDEPLTIIPEVIENHEDYSECDFTLLKGVIYNSVFIQTHEILDVEQIRKMTLPQFILEMMKDPIISLYVKHSPPFIEYFIQTTIKDFYSLLPEFFEESLTDQLNNVFFNQ